MHGTHRLLRDDSSSTQNEIHSMASHLGPDLEAGGFKFPVFAYSAYGNTKRFLSFLLSFVTTVFSIALLMAAPDYNMLPLSISPYIFVIWSALTAMLFKTRSLRFMSMKHFACAVTAVTWIFFGISALIPPAQLPLKFPVCITAAILLVPTLPRLLPHER